MERKRSQRIGQEQWAQHLQMHEQSAQSVAAYCRNAGISESSFYGWRQRLQRNSAQAGFIRLDAGMMKAAAALSITTPNGYRVEASAAEICIAAARQLAQAC